MVVLKVKSSTLLESLVALFIVLLLFLGGTNLLYQYYFHGVNTERTETRNTSQALSYFYRYDSTENWKKRVENSGLSSSQINTASNTIEFSFFLKKDKITYTYVLE